MAQVSGTAEQEIRNLLQNWWLAVNAQLAAATGAAVQIGDAPLDLLLASEIGQRLTRIAAVAEELAAAEARQAMLPWSANLAGQVLEDCRFVENWLNQGPVFQRMPDDFWASPVGYRILAAKVWASQDRLITLGAAAHLSGMSLSVLSQRISRGQLPGYHDPRVKNPKHGRRIRLSDLQILIGHAAARNALPATNFTPAQVQRQISSLSQRPS